MGEEGWRGGMERRGMVRRDGEEEDREEEWRRGMERRDGEEGWREKWRERVRYSNYKCGQWSYHCGRQEDDIEAHLQTRLAHLISQEQY